MCESLTSSQASADSVSDLREPGCEPCNSAKSIPIAEQFSPSIGLTSHATMISKASQELPQTSSVEDFHAKTSQMLARNQGLPARVADCGANTADLLARYDQDTRSWRTSQACILEGWERFSETWPRSGMTRNGTAYQLPPLVPLTDETEYGLWPTPEASNSAAGDARKAIYYLPSGRPRGLSNSGIDGSIGLARMARLFPTPQVGDSKTARNSTARRNVLPPSGVHAGDTLTDAVVPQGGALNPTWVEWLMGFPRGWTELDASEMPSSPKSLKSSGAQL